MLKRQIRRGEVKEVEENGLNLYLQEMWYVKKRTEAIRTIALKEKTTLFPITNIEFMTLQIRKIIEHIAMGNLIANKELYEEYSAKFSSNQNARYIFRDLERLNFKFYPEPVKSDYTKEVEEWITINEDYLTKEDAIKIYEKCGGLLHVSNPYGSQIDVSYYQEKMPIWYKKIMNLLNQHLIHMVDGKHIFFITMNGNGNPQGYKFEQVDE